LLLDDCCFCRASLKTYGEVSVSRLKKQQQASIKKQLQQQQVSKQQQQQAGGKQQYGSKQAATRYSSFSDLSGDTSRPRRQRQLRRFSFVV